MRYETKQDLPATITVVLPESAQDIYLEAYNRIWEAYDQESPGHLSRHDVAHRQAWDAVEAVYLQDEGTGEWHRKGENAEAGQEEDKGFLDKIKGAVEDIVS